MHAQMFTCLFIISLQVMFHMFYKPHFLYKVWTDCSFTVRGIFQDTYTVRGKGLLMSLLHHNHVYHVITGCRKVWSMTLGGVKMWRLRMSYDVILLLPSFMKTGQLIQKLKVEMLVHAWRAWWTQKPPFFFLGVFMEWKRNTLQEGSLCLSACLPANQEVEAPRISRHLGYEGGKVVSPMHRLPLPPGNTPCTHFCWRLSRPQGYSTAGRIMSMKNSRDTIGNWTSDLPASSAVPHTTAPPLAPPLRAQCPYFSYAWPVCVKFIVGNLCIVSAL
jgi:hypothetical protein